ncbi:hypothetical protein B0H15DRAFT_861724 [Mycena belliarum]|uniref:Uncharacterized protein n=1 Tax=Mycena belliarum TaxID=1033014 RepID=A0AAD6TT78_9AGAR|nr:hypothetical protein B0H15DRAFT_861724 [Mycena belliae]
MAISAAEIVAYMTNPLRANEPGISIQIRNRLEWTWGLGHNHLDEHLSQFTDPLHIFTDDSVFVIPSKDMICDIHSHTLDLKFGVRRPHIRKVRECLAERLLYLIGFSPQVYKGRMSFEYLAIPVDSQNPLPGRKVVSEVPPHIALATTSGKMMQHWGYLTGDAYDAVCASLIERSATVLGTPLSLRDLSMIWGVHRKWSFVDHVPASFLAEDSDATMVEAEDLDSPDTTPAPEPSVSNDKNKMDKEVRSSASGGHSPRRRLYPHELEQDFNDLPSVASDDDREVRSSASGGHSPRRRLYPHELEQDFNDLPSVASDDDSEDEVDGVTGEPEADRRWMDGIARWAEGTAAAHEGMLSSSDAMIHDDPGVPVS